jgi:HEPN domain-containing protein
MVEMWLRKSATDLKAAKLLSTQNLEELLGSSVFHSQQAAEKAIKGYLTLKKVRFPKTHDIEKLLNLVATVDSDFAEQIAPATILTQFASAYRYPEEVEPPEPLTDQSCAKAYTIAAWVYEEAKARCKK